MDLLILRLKEDDAPVRKPRQRSDVEEGMRTGDVTTDPPLLDEPPLCLSTECVRRKQRCRAHSATHKVSIETEGLQHREPPGERGW